MALVGETLARHLAGFGSLYGPDRAALDRLEGEVRTVARHRDLMRSGESPGFVVILLDGLLCRYVLGQDGARHVQSFYLPGDAPSLETLFLDRLDGNFGAVVESRIGMISHEPLYELIEAYPQLRKLLWRQTLVQAATFRAWLVRNSAMPARAALAHLLCEMSVRARANGLMRDDRFDLPLTQEIVADALGLTAVHLNRTLKLLRHSGAIEWKSGELAILDWPLLRSIADFDPAYLHLHAGAWQPDAAGELA